MNVDIKTTVVCFTTVFDRRGIPLCGNESDLGITGVYKDFVFASVTNQLPAGDGIITREFCNVCGNESLWRISLNTNSVRARDLVVVFQGYIGITTLRPDTPQGDILFSIIAYQIFSTESYISIPSIRSVRRCAVQRSVFISSAGGCNLLINIDPL